MSRLPAPLVEELTPPPDPEGCCARLAGLPYRVWLDSAARGAPLGRHSFLAADPAIVVRGKGRSAEWLDLATGTRHPASGDAIATVKALLAPHAAEPAPGLPPFQGGAIGYVAYDWGETLERLPAPRYDDLALPDVVFGLYDWVIAWDHAAGRAWLISTGLPAAAPAARARRAADRLAAVKRRLRGAAPTRIAAAPAFPPLTARPREHAPSYPAAGWWDTGLELRSSFSHRDYLAAVARVREYILAGDIFQANLSQRFEAPLTEAPWALYRRLRARNPAPFAAFLDFPEAPVLSASPERFLRVGAAGDVETRPIKGTRPRGHGPEHDAALGRALTESAKDRAENLMIVDLLRNDLSRVCSPGSVRVPELFALERHPTVHHLVSTVVGRLGEGADALDLLRAAFPGGSITGAPKVRAMEIIAELEPSRRGVYCGAVGYWSTGGELDTSIAIRTSVAVGGRVYFSAGGGIVADSDPEQEYRETLDKARGLIAALEPAETAGAGP
ncbi:MAG: aminodeoxychorismate synthase component I [Gemmatimonadaceae bacterium]